MRWRIGLIVLPLLDACSAGKSGAPVPNGVRRIMLKVAPDSAVGEVVVSKSALETLRFLRIGSAPQANISLTISGSDATALGRMAGIRAVMRGIITGNSLGVISFAALSVNGTPVLDGIVRVDNAAISLETNGGRIPLGNPPANLYLPAIARIWLSGPAARGPNDFGIIALAP
jgi:hypothetical protein